jgi:hypothetical protein
MLERLRANGELSWVPLKAHEVKALNRLVKKGLAETATDWPQRWFPLPEPPEVNK